MYVLCGELWSAALGGPRVSMRACSVTFMDNPAFRPDSEGWKLMVRAAQASPDHGFCGVRARAGDHSCLELR